MTATLFRPVAAGTAALLLLPAAALAQAAPAAQPGQAGAATAAGAQATGPGQGLTQGATVYDPSGGRVGTIDNVSGSYAVVDTGQHKVRLPTSSFAMRPTGPTIAMTAAQLDAAAAQAAPAANTPPNVAAGAQVVDTQGGPVGTIVANDGQFATLGLVTGGQVRLPVSAFGPGLNGRLRVAMTAQQLAAAAGASGTAGAGAAPGATGAAGATGTAGTTPANGMGATQPDDADGPH